MTGPGLGNELVLVLTAVEFDWPWLGGVNLQVVWWLKSVSIHVPTTRSRVQIPKPPSSRPPTKAYLIAGAIGNEPVLGDSLGDGVGPESQQVDGHPAQITEALPPFSANVQPQAWKSSFGRGEGVGAVSSCSGAHHL